MSMTKREHQPERNDAGESEVIVLDVRAQRPVFDVDSQNIVWVHYINPVLKEDVAIKLGGPYDTYAEAQRHRVDLSVAFLEGECFGHKLGIALDDEHMRMATREVNDTYWSEVQDDDKPF